MLKLLIIFLSSVAAEYWATEHDVFGRALHYRSDRPSELVYDSSEDGCGVRIYVSTTYPFSNFHISNIFSLVNRTFATQGMPQVFIHEIIRDVSLPDDRNATRVHQRLTGLSDTTNVCAVMWLLGQIFDEGVIGYAYVRGACQCGSPQVAYSAPMRVIDEGEGFLSAVNIEGWIVGHELGHLLGADHVAAANVLMNPQLQQRSPSVQPFIMHVNSRNQMKNYLDQCNDDQCLTKVSEFHTLPKLPHVEGHYHSDGYDEIYIVVGIILPLAFIGLAIALLY